MKAADKALFMTYLWDSYEVSVVAVVAVEEHRIMRKLKWTVAAVILTLNSTHYLVIINTFKF